MCVFFSNVSMESNSSQNAKWAVEILHLSSRIYSSTPSDSKHSVTIYELTLLICSLIKLQMTDGLTWHHPSQQCIILLGVKSLCKLGCCIGAYTGSHVCMNGFHFQSCLHCDIEGI